MAALSGGDGKAAFWRRRLRYLSNLVVVVQRKKLKKVVCGRLLLLPRNYLYDHEKENCVLGT